MGTLQLLIELAKTTEGILVAAGVLAHLFARWKRPDRRLSGPESPLESSTTFPDSLDSDKGSGGGTPSAPPDEPGSPAP